MSRSTDLSGTVVAGVKIPDDLMVVGYITGAYGIAGWVRVKPYSNDAGALLNVKAWWIDKPELHDVEMLQSKMHSGEVVARLMGVAGRDAAEALKGAAVKIARSRFPALPDGEYYWADLIGMAVVNLQGESLGRVADMMDNGAHPILRVAQDPVAAVPTVGAGVPGAVTAADGGRAVAAKAAPERLIPFAGTFIQQVDMAGKTVTVDWGLDY